jgi:phage shock protein PspC (stress-responsive transcriptional regulator)
MTETQGPSATDEQQSTPTAGPQPGVDRASLRSYEQLRRSTTDRKVAGVAGGLGRHLNIDPTLLRVLFVVLCFFGGAGFLLYGVAWALVPEDGRPQGNIAMRPSTRNAVLIAAGVVAALVLVGDSWGGFGFPWPLLLAGVVVLVYLAVHDRGGAPAAGRYPAPYAGQYPAAYPAQDASSYDMSEPSYASGDPAVEGTTTTTYAQQPPAPPWMPPTQTAPDYQAPPPRPGRGPLLFGFTLAMVAVALGVLGLYDASGGQVVDSAYPALALAVVGLMLVVGAFVGRAGGLVLLGIVAALALAVTSLLGSVGDLTRGEGQRLNVTPLTAGAVQGTYYVPSGRVVLDLSRVRDPADLAGRSIEVGARAGEVVVVLPTDVVTDVDADISGPGQIDLPDHSSGGFGNSITETLGSGSGTFSLRAHLFTGHIEVRTS